MSWDTIAPILQQISGRSGFGRRGLRPQGYTARNDLEQRIAAMRSQAQDAYNQNLAATQNQAQRDAELQALRAHAQAVMAGDMQKDLNPNAVGVTPTTTSTGPLAAVGDPGVVGMTLVDANGQPIDSATQARLDQARRQSEAMRALTGRTETFGAIRSETQQQLDAIRAQAAAINAMYAPAAHTAQTTAADMYASASMDPTKGATINPDGTVTLSENGRPGTAPVGTKPTAGIDYSHYRGMTPAQVYAIHANGLPPDWDWGQFASVNGVVDPRTVDAAGRQVGSYAGYGPEYQWGPRSLTTPATTNPVMTSSAFANSFSPDDKPTGPGVSIFRQKPTSFSPVVSGPDPWAASRAATTSFDGSTSVGSPTAFGNYTFDNYTPSDPLSTRPFTFGY